MPARRFPPPWSVEEQARLLFKKPPDGHALLIQIKASRSSICVVIDPPIIQDDGMRENDANDLAELSEDTLRFEVSDDSLERAGVVTDGQAITIGHCTHWWHCSWPM